MAVIKNKKKKTETEITPLVEALQRSFNDIITSAEKFDGGNNSAGTRVRKGLQEAKATIKQIRDAVTEVRDIRKESK